MVQAIDEVEVKDDLDFLETEEQKAIGAKVLAVISAKAYAKAEAMKAKELQSFVDRLKADNELQIKQTIEKIRNEAKPTSPADLEKLLSQEYVEVTFTVKERTNSYNERTFVLRELPQTIELKFLKSIQQTIVPRLREVTSIEWSEGNVTQKLQRLIEMLPDAMDTLAENCATCLDPFGYEKIDKNWVQSNLSSFRIFNVIEAQVMVSKMRDFFYSISKAMST